MYMEDYVYFIHSNSERTRMYLLAFVDRQINVSRGSRSRMNVLGGKHQIVTFKNILNLDVRFLLLHCHIPGPMDTKTLPQYCF